MTIQAELAAINEKAASNNNHEMQQLAFSCIDLTTLNPTDTVSRVKAFAARVNDFYNDYPTLVNVAAICVYPNMVRSVKEVLAVEPVKIAAVAGGFPSSMTFIEMKVQEAKRAVELGADEIDIVLPLWAFLDGNKLICKEEIVTIKEAIGEAHLKVILETGALAEPEKIHHASMLAMEAGADFIKTSTGKMSPAATPEAAIVMCRAIKDFWMKTGKQIGFKPAGGIATTEDAILYLTIVKEILGEEWMNPQLFRIGASRLANNLLSDLLGEEITYF
ncbi:deoxyribose-phosphate aldolase [Mangrovibacterium marinum]|uniref:Deoxyribose-phosphate aldolase n=1 Tax=Mangrovibacterium marinum TaxID=1639118 RepID=A0A2T5C2M7_9BACT|nr:deoxyribose-phosphate aldolase [Mangrovibacterium marinum]PTN08969.1 deoxyribose-phosphate aldolase [Mangrovibacterium marinum]